MSFFGAVRQVAGSGLRLPLRGVDWIKVKLGYVSVPPLREFVYLNETSVISLIASTTGGVTDQKSTVKRRRISGSIGSLSSQTASLTANQEKSTEAVRRYVIQSNFKELYEMRAEDLVIADEYEPSRSIPRQLWGKITPEREGKPNKTEVELERGELVEINVDLGSDKIYDYYTAVESIVKMVDATPEGVIQEIDSAEFSIEQLNAFSELFEHLLAGLVPIVGEVKNYGVVEENGEIRVVEKDNSHAPQVESLNIVGFVDSDKFWTQETRFLFDEDEYTVYGRIDDSTVSEGWMPIKLVSVVSSIVPELGESVHEIPEAFEDTDSNAGSDRDEIKLQPRMETYVKSLEQETDLDLVSEEIDEVVQTALDDTGPTVDRIEGIEEGINRLEQNIDDRCEFDIDESDRDDLLDEILINDFDEVGGKDADREWYLSVSFTAIYW